jgi:uncharacterized protein DUF5683
MMMTWSVWLSRLPEHKDITLNIMGKGPQNIALLCIVGLKAIIPRLLVASLITLFCTRAVAQDMPLVTPTDSTLNNTRDNSNVVIKQDTVTQSISSFDSTSADSTNHKPAKAFLHSAKKAAYLSAVLPGLGQAYNKKYWKIPIIYAGFGGLGYALYYTSSNFEGYRGAYRQQVALVPNYNASFNGVADAATLKAYRDYFKKYLDISAIGVGVWYLLNVVDATVDAHLMGWNLKDDLSISWNPTLIASPNYNTAAAGVTVALHF